MKWVIFISLSIVLSVSALVAESVTGKIAVAVDEKAVTAPVSSRLGRSPFYLLFDVKGTFIEAIDNPYKNDRRKPGTSMIDSLRFDEKGGLTGTIETPSKDEREKIWNSLLNFLAQKGIKVIVAEEFGDEIIRVMNAKGIKCIEFKGRAKDAIKKVLKSN